ncbi:MAG: alpha/beta hydrolase [Thermodesulfobacteriota bacterium]
MPQTVDPRTWHCEKQGDGPPLLLIHGLGASSFSFRKNLPLLGKHFRVLAPDLPAHGSSPAPGDGDYRLEALVRGLNDFLELHGIRQAAVAGNCLGGSLALMLARDYPERVAALILLDPAVALTRVPWIFYPLRLPVLGGLTAALTGPWIIPLAVRLAYHRRELITPEVVAGYARPFRELSRRLAFRSFCQQLKIPPLPEIEALLQQIHQPAVLIWGQEDRILPVRQAGWVEARLPHLARPPLILPQVGHAPQEEAADLVNEIIIDFLTHSRKN